ncbi:hypothetical protein Drorol1_Dr00008902 [Drosera rotundifolia]
MTGCLPAVGKLRERGMEIPRGYASCGSDDESLLHSPVSFPKEVEILAASPFGLPNPNLSILFDEWVLSIIQEQGCDKVGQFVALMSWIRYNRNQRVQSGNSESPHEIVQFSLSSIHNLVLARNENQLRRDNQSIEDVSNDWSVLEVGTVKVNVDVAPCSEGATNVAGILREEPRKENFVR